MIYDKINAFCKVRNLGNCFNNGVDPTPRVKFLMELLDSEGIEYELDTFEEERQNFWGRPRRTQTERAEEKSDKEKKDDSVYSPNWKRRRRRKKNKNNGVSENRINRYFDLFGDDFDDDFDDWGDFEPAVPKINKFFNIIMKGTSNKMIVAHHDVNNPRTDNANDNSASVINVIATKKLRPELNAILLDGEEFGGIGSKRAAQQIKDGKFGSIEWVLNYELTGRGGKYFFIGNYPGKLSTKIINLFNCPVVSTPFNDSVIFRQFGIDSVVINPIPPLPEGEESSVMFHDGKFLDIKMLSNCHSPKDTLDTISVADMKEFVEEVVLKIVS